MDIHQRLHAAAALARKDREEERRLDREFYSMEGSIHVKLEEFLER